VRQIAAETGPVLFLRQPPDVDVRCVNATIEINVFYMNVDVRCVNAALSSSVFHFFLFSYFYNNFVY